MAEFGELPFEDQLAWIRREIDGGTRDPMTLVALTSALPDVEPLCRLFERLAHAGARAEELVDWFEATFEQLPDPALQYVLGASFAEPTANEARLELARGGAARWPLERTTALALLFKWLSTADPAFAEELRDRAALAIGSGATGADRRWLFFLDGPRLARLADDPEWSEIIRGTTRTVLDRLARAPKSLSQANAEALLSRRIYADPGHFLFELMQNADDAGASEWSVCIGERETVVVHDGAPFSFLDVVGICSIGLTTKSRDQIGFFGVGFKSVYEVSARPQIHSGAFHFEIAHVSMPRTIAPRAANNEANETTLVLPHHDEVDPRGLTEKALAIPTETLMTLPNLCRFSVGGVGTAGVTHEEARAGTRVSLNSATGDRVYEIAQDSVPIDHGHSPLLVAASVRADGSLGSRAEPGLFAFLPTAERTGVPVLVHARFEVTMDRERLEGGSARNHSLLEAAGRRYALLIERVASEGRAVLDALPVPTDASELVQPLTAALRASLFDVPCLPGADGRQVEPARARIVHDRLVAAFADIDLGRGERALAPLPRRQTESAAFLGARTFGDHDLVGLLRDRLIAGHPPPRFLGSDLYGVLAESSIADEVLRTLPLLVHGDGTTVDAIEGRSAAPAWVDLYAGVRPLVSSVRLAELGGRLLRRLAIAPFDVAELVGDLAREPALLDREEALLTALADTPELLPRLSAVPLFRGTDGGRYAMDDGIARLDPRLEGLRAALAFQLPLVTWAQARAHPRVVDRALPLFDMARLVTALERGLTLDRGAQKELVSRLDDVATELSAAVVRRASALPIFEDVHGSLRPLTGESRALVPAHAELPGLLLEWPWLARPGSSFVQLCEPPPFGVRSLALTIAERPVESSRLPAIIDWIGAHAGGLQASDVDALAEAPIWPDVEGHPESLERLRIGTSAAVVNAFYAATSFRRVAHPATVRACRRLRLERALPVSDHEAVITDLFSHDVETIPIELIGPVLVDAVGRVNEERLGAVLDLPLFEDEAGVRRALGSYREPHRDRCHRPGPFRRMLRSSLRPLLSETLESELAPFLSRVGPPAATVVDLVRLGEELEIAPGVMLDALLAHADDLDAVARASVGRLRLFESHAGQHHAAHELAPAQVFRDHLGPEQLEQPGIRAHLMTDPARDAARRLGLIPRPAAEVLEADILGELVKDALLAAQPPWARSRADLLGVAGLCAALEVDVSAHPLALDRSGRVVRGPLLDGSTQARAIAAQLPLGRRLADEEWARDPRAFGLTAPLEARAIATELRATCSEELPRDGHPVLAEPEALYGWLREHADAIEADPAARAALGSACVVPSQRGTLRAPSDLVLSRSGPDLGLAWGMAEEVPEDVARFLEATFQMDRQQRGALVTHVLDGVDEAVSRDDPQRVIELLRFLATTLDAGSADADELERQVRRLKIRARLRVPSIDGTFVKPRFGWVPTEETAALADAFMEEPPPKLGIEDLDVATRALLAACGAAPDLSEDTVGKLLAEEGLVKGPTARAALARYVSQRALTEPGLVSEWRLSSRPWVPDRTGTLRRPSELLWPEPAARALFGDDAGGVPDDLAVSGLPSAAAGRLGFVSVASLTLSQIAARIEGRAIGPELIELLEEGLAATRFDAQELARTLGDRIRLTDDEGVTRPPAELAVTGARELFGRCRGDASILLAAPELTRALSVPRSPDLRMMLAFLEERGRALPSMPSSARDDLARHLPELTRRIAGRVERGADIAMPGGAVVLAVRGGERLLSSVADPELRIPEPREVVDALEERLIDALLLLETPPELVPHWLAAGVPDLLAGSRLVSLAAGPETTRPDAAALHAELVRGLGAAAGRRVDVRESLVATFALALPVSASSLSLSYRGASEGTTRVTVRVEAAVHEGTLFVTPLAIDAPVLIAAAIDTDPRRRAALMRWLATDRGGEIHKSARTAPRKERTGRAPPSPGWLSRIREFFRSDSDAQSAGVAGEASHDGRATHRASPEDDSLFRPEHEVRAQIESTDSWVERRGQRPQFGFRFAPDTLPSPWMYAPKLVATEFVRRNQSWRPSTLDRPVSRGDAGRVRLNGTLPRGDSVLPIPLYARLDGPPREGETRLVGPNGSAMVRLAETGTVAFDLVLGEPPDAISAHVADLEDATKSFVPDDELPAEVLDFVEDLGDVPPLEIAFAIRDFVRRRYRYDPTYLEDAAVGRWLARVSRGRAHAHVASLHAAADRDHLGAGVCYELNSLTCELLRRAGVPAGIATGWVFAEGSLSEPDHLWAMAFLQTDRGDPVWVPVDASTTLEGRALRVPRRPPVRARAPSPTTTKRPADPRWEGPTAEKKKKKKRVAEGGEGRPPRASSPRTPARSAPQPQRRPKRERRPPRAELRRLLRYLERHTGREVTPEDQERLEDALQDREGTRELLARLLGEKG